MARPRRPSNFRHIRAAYRSGLEASLAAAIATMGIPVCFEQVVVPYTQPAKARHYTPDFHLPNGIVIESKGLFSGEDRNKMLWVIAQHPDLDIRMVFSNARAKLYKGSPTTYADWCDKHGILHAHRTIPVEWYSEKVNARSLAALLALRKNKR